MSQWKRAAVAGVVALTAGLLAGCNAPVSLKGVRWQDIKSWRAVGTRWAEALDGSSRTVAVYDLSYPRLLDELGELRLGKVGAGRVDHLEMISLLRSPPEEVDDGSAPLVTAAEIDSAVGILAGTRGRDFVDRLPAGWWSTLRWKAGVAVLGGPPAEFSLDDLDWPPMANDGKLFTERLGEATAREIEPGEGPALGGPGFLKGFHFRRDAATGAYEISWAAGATRAAGANAASSASQPSRPRKVIDLTNPQLGWYEALEWEALGGVIETLGDLIPIPVANALFKTAVNRFFRYQLALTDAHLEMLLEEISPAEGATGLSPMLSDLNVTQARAAEVSTAYSTAGLVAPGLWWKQDVAQLWAGDRMQEEDTAARSAAWLKTNAELGEALGTRHAVVRRFPGISGARADGTYGIAAIAYRPSSKHPAPLLAIDYDQPDRIASYREGIAALSAGVYFASCSVPIGGWVVEQVFSRLFEYPIEQAEHWENRLKATLEARPGEDWTREIDTVDRQGRNPFEPDRAASAELIARRKQWLGM